MNCPCKGCTDREVGCHSSCSGYKEWKAEWDRNRDTINKAKTFEREVGEVKVAGMKRMQKRRYGL